MILRPGFDARERAMAAPVPEVAPRIKAHLVFFEDPLGDIVIPHLIENRSGGHAGADS